MSNLKKSFQGIFPILSTPSDKNGNIVFEDLRKQVEWMINNGVNGVGIAIASEIYKYSEKERDEIFSTVVDQVNGRVIVVMNTGGESTDLSIHYSKKAIELGADALMIRPATFIPTTFQENINYFTEISKTVKCPIFMQDQSSAQISPTLAIECAKRSDNLCYIKVETPPTIPRIMELVSLRANENIKIFGGAGGAYCVEEFSRGSIGTMPGSTMPDVWVKIWNNFISGEVEEAYKIQNRFSPLIKILSQTLGLSAFIYKYIMIRRGIFSEDSGYVRGPSLRPDNLHLKEIDMLLEELELI